MELSKKDYEMNLRELIKNEYTNFLNSIFNNNLPF